MTYRQTSTGTNCADHATLLTELDNQPYVRHVLVGVIGPVEVYEAQHKVFAAGGGEFTVRDLCRVASGPQLETAVKLLRRRR